MPQLNYPYPIGRSAGCPPLVAHPTHPKRPHLRFVLRCVSHQQGCLSKHAGIAPQPSALKLSMRACGRQPARLACERDLQEAGRCNGWRVGRPDQGANQTTQRFPKGFPIFCERVSSAQGIGVQRVRSGVLCCLCLRHPVVLFPPQAAVNVTASVVGYVP